MYRSSKGVREPHRTRRSLAGALLLGAALSLVPCLRAADGTWTQTTSGNFWSIPGNWASGTIADGSGSTANFNTLNITADVTVRLDTPRTIGNLIFGDSVTSSAANWILDDNGDIANVLTLAGTTPTITVNALGTGRTATISLVLAGSSGLVKAGSGTLVLSGANTYSGATAINAGALRLTNGSALGGSTVVSVTAGARLELSGGLTFGSGSTVTINGDGGDFNGALRSLSGTNVWAGDVVIGSTGTRIGAMSGAVLEISGVISGANALIIRNQDLTGTTILSGANTYNGPTSFVGGLSVSVIGSVGAASSNLGAPTTAANGQINIGLGANTATLIYTGSGETTNRVVRIASTDTSGATIDQSGTGLLRFTSNLSQDATAPATRTLTLTGSSAGTGEFAGAIADAGVSAFTSLTKAGTGTWTLSGANSYSGITTLNGGTLQVTTLANINTNSSIGRGSAAGSAADWVFGGGTLLYNTAAAASTNRLFTLGNANGLTATINSSAAASADFLSFTGIGNIAFGGSGPRTLTLTGSNLGNNTFSPFLGNGTGGATSLLKSGSGLWILTGANNYSGTTTIGNGGGVDAGTLRFSGSGTLGSGVVTVFGGALDLNGTIQTISSLNVGGGAAGSTATVSIGSGDLRLGGNVTFNGANNPNGALISSTTGFISLLGNRTFTVGDSTAAAQDLTISAIIRDGDGTPRILTKSGTGVLFLSGANTYSGGTIVSQGATNRGLVLLANNAIGSGPLIIGDANTTGNGARFSLNGYNQTVSALSSGATAATRVIEAGGSTGGAVSTLTVDQASNTTYNGFIRDHSGVSGQLAIIKTGVGFLDFSGAQASQNYSGGLTVNDGILGFAAAANLGTGVITLGGGTLRYTPTGTTSLTLPNASIVLTNATESTIEITDAGGSVTASGAVTGGGSLNKTGAGRLSLSGGSSSYGGGTKISGGILNFSNVAALGSGAVTFAANSTLEAGVGGTLANAIVIDSTVTGTFNTQNNNVVASGIVSGDGALNKEGSGRLTLSNSGTTYAGGTSINAGLLRYDHLAALGTGAVSFTADSTLESGVGGDFGNDIVIANGVIGTIDTLANTVTFSGEITGQGQILKKGSGILYLSNANNSFSGGLVVENASTSIVGPTALGVVLLANNAAGTGPLTIGNASTGTARFSLNGYDQTVSALSSGSVGIRVLEANGTAGGAVSTLTVDQDTNTSYTGFLRDQNTGGGQLALVKTGSGLLDLSGAQTASTYSGGLTVNEGTIGFANTTNIGSGAITLGGGTLRYTPTGTTALTIPNASISLTASTVSTIEVTDAGGTLTSSGIISGLGELNKSGAGTLVLTNANTYDGQTAVTEGALFINGNQSGATGAFVVSAGATLGGDGTIGGDTTIGGNLRVGSDASVLTTGSLEFSGGNLAFTSGSTWFIDIVGASSDTVNNIGTFSIDPAATLNFSFSGPTEQSYTLATYTNRANTNTFSGFDDGAIISGYQINYSNTGITLTAVPEPGTFGLLGLLLGGIFFYRARLRRHESA